MTKNTKNSIYYEQELNDVTYKIIHSIMANEDSEARNYYNIFAIEHLKTILIILQIHLKFLFLIY